MEKKKENDITLEEFLTPDRDESESEKYWEEIEDYFDNMSDEELLQYGADHGVYLDVKTVREALKRSRDEIFGKK